MSPQNSELWDGLGEPQEIVPPPARRQGLRLVAALLGIALLLGALFTAGTWIVGTFAQTEAGLCRITWAPCTELSLSSVESLSGVDLPPGTQVVSGYALESAESTVFRAEVIVPDGGRFTLSNEYTRLDAADPTLVPAATGEQLQYWSRSLSGEGSRSGVAVGLDAQGRTVIFFDTDATLSQ